MRRFRMAGVCLAAVIALGVGADSAAAFSAAALGRNGDGQLGNGTTHESNSAVVVEAAAGGALTGVEAVAAGENHSLALIAGGKVDAWGSNDDGQLGDGTTEDRHKAVPVEGLGGAVTSIAAGYDFSLALLENGHVEAWGNNSAGELGDGKTEDSTHPVEVKGLSKVIAIAAGEMAGYALLESGEVVSWGNNRYGELGNGTIGGNRLEPGPVELPGKATAVAGGGYQALALLSSGEVADWGSNSLGQLGHPGSPNTGTPVLVTGLSEVKAIASGYFFSMALLKSGKVEAWGEDAGGQLGDGSFGAETCEYVGLRGCSRKPVEVAGLSEVTAIAAGYDNGYALKESGIIKPLQKLYGWGRPEGLGTGKSQNSPILLSDVNEVHGVAGGSGFFLTAGPPLPTVTALSETSGLSGGGNHVTISGTHLSGGKVKFGGVEATITTPAPTETSITVEAPKHSPGNVAVTVTTSAGTSPRVAGDIYTYLPGSNIVIGRCMKVTAGSGKYKSASCTEPLLGGSWEWLSGFTKAGFSGNPLPETAIAIESVAGAKILCTGQTASGEYHGTVQVNNVTLKLTGCELVSSGAKCSSSGAASGEILSGTLQGTLGWVEKETNKVGLELFPAGEGLIFAAECGSTAVALTGEVIGQITPLDTMRSTFTVKFKQKKGVQSFQHFWTEINNETLEISIAGGAYEQAGLALEGTLTNEEELEINTVI